MEETQQLVNSTYAWWIFVFLGVLMIGAAIESLIVHYVFVRPLILIEKWSVATATIVGATVNVLTVAFLGIVFPRLIDFPFNGGEFIVAAAPLAGMSFSYAWIGVRSYISSRQ